MWKKNKCFGLAVVFAVVLLPGCTNSLKAPDYILYLTNPAHGMYQELTINKYLFTIQYKPLDWMMLQDFESSTANADELRKKYESSSYFVLKIKGFGDADIAGSTADMKNNVSITPVQSYLNFGIQEDIYMVAGPDTLPCMAMHHEPYNAQTDINTFALAFEKPPCTDCDYSIIYSGNYFNNSLLKFYFRKEQLNQLPKLKL
jgi:hypothetical protein